MAAVLVSAEVSVFYSKCNKTFPTLHHSTTSPTNRLVGKTACADTQSVGKKYYRPTASVGVSPDGKTFSRPTCLSRPTVGRL